ncbi:MAG TPA: ring-cleaving dioxygenase [Ktedonobacter sp.]|jgi:glyoxalase family protein|nr:ring-cleaving dioxygenase [Ktedonobacter sp.]HAG98276.1 ring-cleaving dioxygenase [Ktedonobacter sp.]HAT46894.1 ring-cleaving dioxygenase [Ktedonobacter sp.]HBE28598.1 ring-cleaving dioxygenase [Ktedonobacter sp.]HCF88129.1 ring-cleaving dioxygenase [Ktedonobacter sp.]
MQLSGIHHVTAVTGNASRNVAFYTQVLGMRLTKKTVNQDDVSAYHLFYGDELGRPGTDLTFFDWPDTGYHRPGTGTISTISLGVTGRDALNWWEKRFNDFNISHDGIQKRGTNERLVLPFRDPEGQRLELVDDAGKLESTPWRKSPVLVEMAIHGFYAVRLTLSKLEPSARFLTEILGFRRADTYQTPEQTSVTVFEVGSGGPGAEVHVEIHPEWPFHRFVGIGGVHHVAFRTPNEEEHRQWRDKIAKVNPTVTPVIDRFYFHSIYFREPGGVLFEIATDGPGFAVDEDVATLGERLSLPPFLEQERQVIEAHLRPITPVDLTVPLK